MCIRSARGGFVGAAIFVRETNLNSCGPGETAPIESHCNSFWEHPVLQKGTRNLEMLEELV
jgi:hypothetical protein